MSNFFYIDPEKETVPGAIGKGLLAGGVLSAGLYGLSDIKDFLSKKLFGKRPYPEHIYFDRMKDKEEDKEKKASLEAMNFPAKYMYGLSLVGGGYGTYKLIEALKNKYNQEAIRGDMRTLESTIEDEIQEDLNTRMREPEPSHSVYFAMDKQSSLDTKLEMKKMAADPTVRGFIDGFTTALEKQANILPKFVTDLWDKGGDATKFMLWDLPTKYAPITYGALSGIGGIGGWELGKYFFDPEYATGDYAVAEAPLAADTELIYKFKRQRDKEEQGEEDKVKGLLNEMHTQGNQYV